MRGSGAGQHCPVSRSGYFETMDCAQCWGSSAVFLLQQQLLLLLCFRPLFTAVCPCRFIFSIMLLHTFTSSPRKSACGKGTRRSPTAWDMTDCLVCACST